MPQLLVRPGNFFSKVRVTVVTAFHSRCRDSCSQVSGGSSPTRKGASTSHCRAEGKGLVAGEDCWRAKQEKGGNSTRRKVGSHLCAECAEPTRSAILGGRGGPLWDTYSAKRAYINT